VGVSVTIEVSVLPAIGAVGEVRFYWWKYNGSDYDTKTLIATQAGGSSPYSQLWTFPSCVEYPPGAPGDEKARVSVEAQNYCGAVDSDIVQDLILNGRGC
jgi:hypothetical protein